jgi:hypothetical protein
VVAGLLLVLVSGAQTVWEPSGAARRWLAVRQSLNAGVHGGLHRFQIRCGIRCWRRSGRPSAPIHGLKPTSGERSRLAAGRQRKGTGQAVPGPWPTLQRQAAAAADRSAPVVQLPQRQPQRHEQPSAVDAARHAPSAAPEPQQLAAIGTRRQNAAAPHGGDGGSGDGGGHGGGLVVAPGPHPRSAQSQQAVPLPSMSSSKAAQGPAAAAEVHSAPLNTLKISQR